MYQLSIMAFIRIMTNPILTEILTSKQRTQAKCLEAVQIEGSVLAFLEKHEKTPEICLAAVRQNEFAFRYIPYKYWEQISIELGQTSKIK